MSRVLIAEYYAPCHMYHASNLMSQALMTEHHAPCTMHACKSYLVLKISPKLASGYVPRYGPLIISCLVKGLQFDFRIIKRFIINKTNNELMIMIIIIVCVIFKSRIKNMIFSIFCYFTKLINMIL